MRQKKDKIELACLQCGKKHEKLQCQLRRGRGKFCSKECANKFRNNGSTVKCNFCGTEFYRRFGEQQKAVSKFCSKDCYTNDRVLNAKKTTYLKTGKEHIHRLVAEKALRRKLKISEVVHHIDENKKNNTIENLAILPNQNIQRKIRV